jgi:putative tryptophan/tyrosine transport system substrate-binding protein
MLRMKRRKFIALIAGAAATWPLAARAQRPERMRRVGLLWGIAADDPEYRRRFSAFAEALQELGWIEGKNVTFAPKHAVGSPDRFSAMAADLVRMNSDIIVTTSAGLTSLARQATSTIPIVAASAGELEGTGLIASLRRPGGNVTGIQVLNPELMSKRVDLLKRLVPNLTRLGIVVPITPAGIVTPNYMERIAEAARALQVQVQPSEVHSAEGFAPAIAAMARECQAAIVISNPLASSNAKVIADSAAQNRLTVMYELRLYTLAGGLLSYGADLMPLLRQAATYVDKLLRGANPGDLPIQQPIKFELVINLKAAKTLGLEIPPTILALADEVIE